MEQQNVEMGPITQQDLAMHQTRQEEMNTTINPNGKKIQMEIDGSWVDVFVDFVLLWEAFGLPLHNIFNAGIFCGCSHNKIIGQDVTNVDHRGTAADLENCANQDEDGSVRDSTAKNMQAVQWLK